MRTLILILAAATVAAAQQLPTCSGVWVVDSVARNGRVELKCVAALQGPPGPQGPKGDVGPQGPPGVAADTSVLSAMQAQIAALQAKLDAAEAKVAAMEGTGESCTAPEGTVTLMTRLANGKCLPVIRLPLGEPIPFGGVIGEPLNFKCQGAAPCTLREEFALAFASVPGIETPNSYGDLNDFSRGQIVVQRGIGIPPAEACATTENIGKIYARSDVASQPVFACGRTPTGFAWVAL